MKLNFTTLMAAAQRFDRDARKTAVPRVSLEAAVNSVITGSGEKRRLRKSWPKPLAHMTVQDSFNKQLWQLVRFDTNRTNSIGGLMTTSMIGPTLTEHEWKTMKTLARMIGSVDMHNQWMN